MPTQKHKKRKKVRRFNEVFTRRDAIHFIIFSALHKNGIRDTYALAEYIVKALEDAGITFPPRR